MFTGIKTAQNGNKRMGKQTILIQRYRCTPACNCTRAGIDARDARGARGATILKEMWYDVGCVASHGIVQKSGSEGAIGRSTVHRSQSAISPQVGCWEKRLGPGGEKRRTNTFEYQRMSVLAYWRIGIFASASELVA